MSEETGEVKETPAEINQKRNALRLNRMEEIADNAEKGRPEEIEGVEKEDESARTERLAAEEDAAAKAEAKRLQEEGATEVADETTARKTEDTDTKTVNGEVYYRQMVNGQEKWQSIKEIRNAAQKVESADEYLRQASESVRNSARLALSEKDETSSLSKDEMKKLLASVALGDEEAIDKLASAITARPSEVTPDVLRAVDQRLSFRTELASLEDKSKDLLENENLGLLFRTKLQILKERDPNTTLAEAYTSIDKELRTAFPGFKAKISEKLERKRTLSQPLNAAARQHVEAEEEGEEDLSVVIEKMAKARGIQPHLHPKGQS